MEGFTVKCNKCGKEVVILTTEDFNQDVYFYAAGYDGELGIHCQDCNNCITEGDELDG